MDEGKRRMERLPVSACEKRPYEKPRIVHSEEVEALAGVCDPAANGKQPGNVTCDVFRS